MYLYFQSKESVTIAEHKHSQRFQKILTLYIGDFQLHILGLIFHQLDYLDMHICLLGYLLDIFLIKNFDTPIYKVTMEYLHYLLLQWFLS